MRDWKTRKLELLLEASRHAEAKMAAQVQLAVSADARASILCGVYAAAATGMLVVLATSADLQKNHFAVTGIFTATAFFVVGAVVCVWAAWPCSFRLPGNEPSSWYEDIDNDVELREAVGGQLQIFDDEIRENNKTLKRNARRFQLGVIAGMVAPVAGLIAGWATTTG